MHIKELTKQRKTKKENYQTTNLHTRQTVFAWCLIARQLMFYNPGW
jgi:hypothetical protein